MDTIFPFGFPPPSAMYLTLYVLTLAVHVIFMNYVLAGTGYLACASLFGGHEWSKDAIARVLRDWMPFALGATITAGVAPLLFVQVLYQQSFYTANLLLFHHWMSILPVLIAAFYLLYLLKARRVASWPRMLQCTVAVVAFLCVGFTGYSWAENHSLSLERALWPQFYETQSMMYRNWALLPRFLTWACGAVGTMCLLVAWQLRFYERRDPPSGESVHTGPQHVRRLALLAIAGLVAAALCGIWYWGWAGLAKREAITSALSAPYLALAGLGIAVEIAGWAVVWRGGRARAGALALISTGLGASIIGAAIVRESIRIHAVDFASLLPAHARAAAVGAFWAFAVFLALNGVLIWWSLRQVRHCAASGRQP